MDRRRAIAGSYPLDYYGNCDQWRRIANLMPERYGDVDSATPYVARGTPVRIQTCVSAKHRRYNLVYCSKLGVTRRL